MHLQSSITLMKSPPKSSIIHLCLLHFLFFSASLLKAQYFSLGQEPSSVRWHQINTENFRVLASEDFLEEAMHLSWTLEEAYQPVSASLKVLPKRIPVILNNHSVYSNAMVPYAPRRMEFFTTPPQDIYGQPWLDQLVLHESRHSVQYSKMYQGFTKGLYYLFGEQAIAGIYGAFVPFWFIEGDAVVTETALSNSGRGRVPSFLMKLHAQWAEKGIYRYGKAYNGSFKDFVPDYYELGYVMVAGLRSRYGGQVISNTLDRVARKPFTFVPFSHGLYKNTGYGKVKLYRSVTDSLSGLWSEKDENIERSAWREITKKSSSYTEYLFPRFIDENSVVALKKSIDDINRIVVVNINTGVEQRITTPGPGMMEYSLSTDGRYIYWTERVADPRWDKRDYSEIIKFDVATGKREHLTTKTRYFSPEVSPDGKKIAVINVSLSNEYSLVILDAFGGNIIQEFQSPENIFLMTPSWSDDNRKIAAIGMNDDGKTIIMMDLEERSFSYIIPFTFTEISSPSFSGEDIIFTGGYGGTDNLCKVNVTTGEIRQITSVKFGAAHGRSLPGKDEVVFSNYDSRGYSLALASLDDYAVPMDEIKDRSIGLERSIASQEGYVFINRDSIPDQFADIKRYRRISHLFNLHSWVPLGIDVDNSEVNPGITLLSQNLLSNSFTTIGYQYNTNENGWKTYLNYSYQGLYPIIDLEADFGLRKSPYTDKDGKLTELRWYETNITPAVRIPFNFSKNQWYRGIQPYIGYTFTNLDMVEGVPYNFKYDKTTSLVYQVSAYQQTEMSPKDLYPRWGQSIELSFQHSTAQSDFYSSLLAAQVYLYFPGIIKHHGLRLYAAYQQRAGEYPFSDVIQIPRGYASIDTDNLLSVKLDYVLPLAYPDFNLGSLLYIKRFRSRLFADLAYTFDVGGENIASLGFDLTADFHLFTFFAPFEAGIRSIYIPDNETISFQFLLSFGLSPVN